MQSSYNNAEAARHISFLALEIPFSLEDVRAVRRENARSSHPDRFQADGGERLALAQKHMADVNSACDYLESHFTFIVHDWANLANRLRYAASSGFVPETVRGYTPRRKPLWKRRVEPSFTRAKTGEEPWDTESARNERAFVQEVRRKARQKSRKETATAKDTSSPGDHVHKQAQQTLKRREEALAQREAQIKGREAEADFYVSEARRRAAEAERGMRIAEQRVQTLAVQHEHNAKMLEEAAARQEATLKQREADLHAEYALLTQKMEQQKRERLQHQEREAAIEAKIKLSEADLQKREAQLRQQQAAVREQSLGFQQWEAKLLQQEAALALHDLDAAQSAGTRPAPPRSASPSQPSASPAYDYKSQVRQQRIQAGCCPDCGKPFSQWWDKAQKRCGYCGSPACNRPAA